MAPICVEIPPGLEEIVPDYLASQKKAADTLHQLLAASDLEGIRRFAHNLRNGAAFGFPVLTEIADRMERSLREANLTEVTAQIVRLAEYLVFVLLRTEPRRSTR